MPKGRSLQQSAGQPPSVASPSTVESVDAVALAQAAAKNAERRRALLTAKFTKLRSNLSEAEGGGGPQPQPSATPPRASSMPLLVSAPPMDIYSPTYSPTVSVPEQSDEEEPEEEGERAVAVVDLQPLWTGAAIGGGEGGGADDEEEERRLWAQLNDALQQLRALPTFGQRVQDSRYVAAQQLRGVIGDFATQPPPLARGAAAEAAEGGSGARRRLRGLVPDGDGGWRRRSPSPPTTTQPGGGHPSGYCAEPSPEPQPEPEAGRGGAQLVATGVPAKAGTITQSGGGGAGAGAGAPAPVEPAPQQVPVPDVAEDIVSEVLSDPRTVR